MHGMNGKEQGGENGRIVAARQAESEQVNKQHVQQVEQQVHAVIPFGMGAKEAVLKHIAERGERVVIGEVKFAEYLLYMCAIQRLYDRVLKNVQVVIEIGEAVARAAFVCNEYAQDN